MDIYMFNAGLCFGLGFGISFTIVALVSVWFLNRLEEVKNKIAQSRDILDLEEV